MRAHSQSADWQFAMRVLRNGPGHISFAKYRTDRRSGPCCHTRVRIAGCIADLGDPGDLVPGNDGAEDFLNGTSGGGTTDLIQREVEK